MPPALRGTPLWSGRRYLSSPHPRFCVMRHGNIQMVIPACQNRDVADLETVTKHNRRIAPYIAVCCLNFPYGNLILHIFLHSCIHLYASAGFSGCCPQNCRVPLLPYLLRRDTKHIMVIYGLLSFPSGIPHTHQLNYTSILIQFLV